jgi:hypothetical protein
VVADLNGDDYLDIYQANQGSRHKVMCYSDGSGIDFNRITSTEATAITEVPRTPSHAVAYDLTGDSNIDIYIANGELHSSGSWPGSHIGAPNYAPPADAVFNNQVRAFYYESLYQPYAFKTQL